MDRAIIQRNQLLGNLRTILKKKLCKIIDDEGCEKMTKSEKPRKQLKGRSCYGHLGGTLGERLFVRLLELGWFEQDGEKATVCKVTALGEEKLVELGVEIYEKRL